MIRKYLILLYLQFSLGCGGVAATDGSELESYLSDYFNENIYYNDQSVKIQVNVASCVIEFSHSSSVLADEVRTERAAGRRVSVFLREVEPFFSVTPALSMAGLDVLYLRFSPPAAQAIIKANAALGNLIVESPREVDVRILALSNIVKSIASEFGVNSIEEVFDGDLSSIYFPNDPHVVFFHSGDHADFSMNLEKYYLMCMGL